MKSQNSMVFWYLMAVWFLGMWTVVLPCSAAGYWTPLANPAPGSINLMLLLPDGTVMAAENDPYDNGDNNWHLLTPDAGGHYVNGSWSNLPSMTYTRKFYSSQVLPSGKVFVAGGEYGTGSNTVETFDIPSKQWTTINSHPEFDGNDFAPRFKDAESVTLSGGKVMLQPPATIAVFIYDPDADSWLLVSNEPPIAEGENSWVKLADGSILTVNPISNDTNGVEGIVGNGTNSEHYIPSMTNWIYDANLPVSLWAQLDGAYGETGPAFLLPNGNAFFLGGSGHTAIYTPSPLGGTNMGSWVQGPDIPGGLVSADAPACMMPNGKILCAVAQPPSFDADSDEGDFPSPTSFFEFDYTDHTQNPYGSFAQVASPTGGTNDNVGTFLCTMLMLPDGTVLYSHMGTDLYVYQPDAPTVAVGKPAIKGITVNPDGSFHLTGTGLNGISQGAAYGDDAQMDSNYPLVRITDIDSHVTYGYTFNWSSTGVQTGTNIVSTDFTVPFAGGLFSLQVVANGIASDPVQFYGPVWVDFNYSTNSPQFGTFANPFSTLAQGAGAVISGGNVYIKPGLSAEKLRIAKMMTLNAVGGNATIGD